MKRDAALNNEFLPSQYEETALLNIRVVSVRLSPCLHHFIIISLQMQTKND